MRLAKCHRGNFSTEVKRPQHKWHSNSQSQAIVEPTRHFLHHPWRRSGRKDAEADADDDDDDDDDGEHGDPLGVVNYI